MLQRLLAVATILGALGSPAVAAGDCAYDPARTHMSRIVAADSTNAPIYGQILNVHLNKVQSRSLVLHDHEVVLSFDDGPLAPYTYTVLDVLDRHCVKAVFFSVGKMALANPKAIQEVERRGHTVGTHTWSHPRGMDRLPIAEAKMEIEKGFAAVSYAMGKPIAPFFRFPGLRDSPETVAYMAQRNISVWSVDVVSGDTEPGANPEKLKHDTLVRIKQLGKGIILFHDIKKVTSESLDAILTALEQEGFRFVQVVSNTSYQPDEEIINHPDLLKLPKESVSITGQWAALAKEQVKDGNVDVMRTEWLDLKQASEQIMSANSAGRPLQSAGPIVNPGWMPISRPIR